MLKTIVSIIFCWLALIYGASLNATSEQIRYEDLKAENDKIQKILSKLPSFLTAEDKKDIIEKLNASKTSIKDINIVLKDPSENLTSTDPNTVFIKSPFPPRTVEKNAPINPVQERLRKKFDKKEANKLKVSNKKETIANNATAEEVSPTEEKKDKSFPSQPVSKKTKKKKTKKKGTSPTPVNSYAAEESHPL